MCKRGCSGLERNLTIIGVYFNPIHIFIYCLHMILVLNDYQVICSCDGLQYKLESLRAHWVSLSFALFVCLIQLLSYML